MSDLAKDLLTRYYGLGAETCGLRFLSVHQSVENAKKEEEKQIIEQISTTINEDIISDVESEKDDDGQNLTTRKESNRRSSNILDDFDDYDTDKHLDAFNIQFAPSIFYENVENHPSTLPEGSYCEIAQNTARSTIETERNNTRDENENCIENDLKPTVAADSILDNSSEGSIKETKKSRISSKSSSKNSILLPPLERKKTPVCNDTFADFSHTKLREFPREILSLYRHLRMLYLSNNELTEIPDEVFGTLKYLEWLDVRNNQLTSLSAAIEWHPSLETILLQGNQLESLPLELCTLPNLHTFQVTQNPLVWPPEDIVTSGSAAIMDYLRLEWNKTHPDKRIEPKKNRIEPKLSTILCYQSPRKSKKLAPLKDAYHNKIVSTRERRKLYRPSNRCENRGANILLENRALWFSKAKEVLARQAAIVQKMKDTSTLKDWRVDKKSYRKAMEKARNRNEDDIPFGFDFDDYASIFKQNPKSKNVGPKRRNGAELRPPKDINKKINELLESLNKLEINITGETTPRTKQYMFKDEIEKIMQFQNEIQNLRKYNEVGTVSLRN